MILEALRRTVSSRFPGMRGARRARPLGFCEHELLAALRDTGCPVCRVAGQSEPHYLFWLLHEGNAEPDLFDALTASLGFCPTHAATILRDGGGASRTALMHEVVAKRLLRIWRDERRNRAWVAKIVADHGAPARCPVCRSRDGAAERAAFFLGKLIEAPPDGCDYGRPGLVCAPHLRLLAPHLRTPTLGRILSVHQAALRRATKRLAERPTEGERAIARMQRAALHLAVGHAASPVPPVSEIASPPRRARRAAEDVEALIGHADACAICRIVARARGEWIAWLDAHARTDDAIVDLLPACRDHVWGAWSVAGPALRVAVTENALRVARHRVETARKFLVGKPPPPNARRPLASLVALVRGRGYFIRLARAAVARDERCPVCARLATARDRSLSLLFALLEERRHRETFEAGYGLCLKHFARALSLAPRPPVREFLTRVEAAKLARLAWELDEHARKAAWQARPEAAGGERHAPVAAMHRFASWGEDARTDAPDSARK